MASITFRPPRARAWFALIAVLALARAGSSEAATSGFDFAQVDRFIETQMGRNGIPGLAIAITENDRVLHARGYGLAARDRAMTPNTPMYIGSTSKSFTALAIMQLEEQGKVALEAPVRRYIPWFKLADDEAARTITVRDLLHHQSGLSDLQYLEIGRVPDDASIEAGVRDLQAARPVAPVGTSFHYFNPGYATLGLIVERVSGEPYAQYVQRHILEPLRMTRTFTKPEPARQAGLAQGHNLFFGFNLPREQPFRRFALPDGYLISTVNDMTHFLIAMNEKGVYKGQRVLSENGMLELFTPSAAVPFYAKGWMLGEHRGYRLIQHGGTNDFFKSEQLLLPGRGIAVSILINQGYLPSAFKVYYPMAMGVLDVLLGLPAQDVPSGWNMRQFGWALLGILGAQLLFVGWSVSRLRGWRARALKASRWWRVKDIGLNFLVTPLIALGIYLGTRAYMGRGFDFWHAFDGVPDAIVILLVGFVGDDAQGLYKLWALYGAARTGHQTTTASPIHVSESRVNP